MKLLFVLALVVAATARPDNHYDTKYDNFDVDQMTGNPRLMCPYAHCFIGDGKCTPEGNDIKGWIKEGTETTCAKCTDKQKILVAKFIKGLQVTCPDQWKILKTRADPEGKREDELNKFLAENAP